MVIQADLGMRHLLKQYVIILHDLVYLRVCNYSDQYFCTIGSLVAEIGAKLISILGVAVNFFLLKLVNSN